MIRSENKMPIVDFSLRRIDAFLGKIKRLEQSEFPHKAALIALNSLKREFTWRKSVVQKAEKNPNPHLVLRACRLSLVELRDYVPYLGFILRSTNTRNAFEVHAPLLRLARLLLGSGTKLIVSSEWNYVPFVYPSTDPLPGFVLIGLPAPESSNPLLIPLAGHELGHAVWKARDLDKDFTNRVKDKIQDTEDKIRHLKVEITKSVAQSTRRRFPDWLFGYQDALSQTEEIFCDLFGLRLFAEAYLYAFEYLSFPGLAVRSLRHPSIGKRISYLTKAAEHHGIELPVGFKGDFMEQQLPKDPIKALAAQTAEAVALSFVDELISLAWEVVLDKDVPLRDREKVECIYEEFKSSITPTFSAETLVDILNAGWRCDQDSKLWAKFRHIKKAEKKRLLGDLMLKSMEVSEFYAREPKRTSRSRMKGHGVEQL